MATIKSQQSGFIKTSLAFIIIFTSVIVIIESLDAKTCMDKWADSGLTPSWGFFPGCRVILPDGRIIPEEAIRNIDIKNKE